jgi:hypothetical protein
MAAAAAAVSAIGTIGSTIGKVQAADVQSKALDRQAEAIESNAQLEEAQQRRRSLIMRGQANAMGAASGVSIGSGSPLLMELDRAKQSEIEALGIRRQGQMGANNARFESRMVRRSIPYTILEGAAGGGSILSQYMAAK